MNFTEWEQKCKDLLIQAKRKISSFRVSFFLHFTFTPVEEQPCMTFYQHFHPEQNIATNLLRHLCVCIHTHSPEHTKSGIWVSASHIHSKIIGYGSGWFLTGLGPMFLNILRVQAFCTHCAFKDPPAKRQLNCFAGEEDKKQPQLLVASTSTQYLWGNILQPATESNSN